MSIHSFFKRLFLLILLSNFFGNCFAQDTTITGNNKEEYLIGLSGHFGWVIIHHASFADLITGHTQAFEINFAKQTIHKNTWNEYYRYPLVGVSYFFADLGNPSQLGYAHGLYGWINFPLIRTKEYTMSFRLGTGLGYITKHFDRLTDHKDEVIGSHINGIMHGNFEQAFRITNQISLYANVGITHFSNGAYKTPNLGINIATGSIGITYRFGKDTIRFPKHKERIPFTDRKISYNFVVAGFAKEVIPPDGKKYGALSISGLAIKQMGYKSGLGLGLDYFYDGSLKTLFMNDTNFIGKNYIIERIGIYIAHELAIGKVRVVTDLGYYLLSDWKENGMVYSRLGIKYYMSKSIFANVTLKTHYAKADFLELGIGYKFL